MVARRKERTTIVVDKETRERLSKHGSKFETYDEIVRRLLDSFEREGKGGVEAAE